MSVTFSEDLSVRQALELPRIAIRHDKDAGRQLVSLDIARIKRIWRRFKIWGNEELFEMSYYLGRGVAIITEYEPEATEINFGLREAWGNDLDIEVWRLKLEKGLLGDVGALLSGTRNGESGFGLSPQRGLLRDGGFSLRCSGLRIVSRRSKQLLHVASLDASIPPQSVRSSPEVKSEERECERRECSDCALILISEIGSTSKNETRSEIRLDDHHGDSSGVTFVKALILGGILVAMYTAFKRLGWLDKDDDEEETDHPKGPPRDPSP